MRLIDADELKKAIKENGYSHYFEIFAIIDNAPTVKPNLKLFKEWKCQDCEERERSFHDGYQMAKNRYKRG